MDSADKLERSVWKQKLTVSLAVGIQAEDNAKKQTVTVPLTVNRKAGIER
jgi:hypothetical protein